MPFLIVADDLKAERLVPALPEYTATGTLIHAVYPAGRHMPTAVRTFLDFLVKRLREVGPHFATEKARPPNAEPKIIPPVPRSRAAEDETVDHARPIGLKPMPSALSLLGRTATIQADVI